MAEEARIHISSHDEYEPEILTQSQATLPGVDRGSGDERDDGDNGVTDGNGEGGHGEESICQDQIQTHPGPATQTT